MDTFLIAFFGIFMIIAGYLMLKRWFNHLTIYSVIWTIVLGLYSLRLIGYYSLIPRAWVLIILGWIALYLGSTVVLCAKKTIRAESMADRSLNDTNFKKYIKTLRIAIIVSSMIGFLGILSQWHGLIKIFGNIRTAFAYSNLIYQFRVGGVIGGIPYLSSFILTASTLGGVYSRLRNRIDVVSILPLIFAVIQGMTTMARAGIIIAGTLFISAYLISSKFLSIKRKIVVPIIVVFCFILFGSEKIRSTRGVTESYEKYGESEFLSNLRDFSFITPSIYLYTSGHPVVFSEYLKKGREEFYPGWYTFAPIYRLLAKFDIVKRPSYYQPFYLTPVPMNTGTYLREIHADFGVVGVLFFPFLLGFICTTLFLTPRFSVLRIIILSYLYVIVIMSFTCNAAGLGYWMISFLITILITHRIEKTKG